jgi:lysophospholipase L1-like esterase
MATATQASYNYLVDMFADVNDSFSPDPTSYIFKATGNTSHLYMYCYTTLNSAIDVSITVKKVSSLSELGDVYNVIGESISGLPISFRFDPDYSYSSSAMNIGSFDLDAGTYALTYRQEEGAEPMNLNTRFSPWFKGVNHGNVFQYVNPTNVSREKCDKVWVFNISETDTYTFYFWCRLVNMLNSSEEWFHVSNIQLFKVDNIYGRLYESIENRNKKTDVTYSYISQFQRIGCVGDSWTAGSIYQDESTWAGTLKNLSWDKNAERLTGSHFVQYAKGGLSSKTWLTDMNGKAALENDDPCGLYFVFLGINDATELTNSEISLGQVDDFENNVEGTFYYYYGAVVNSIITHSPSSKIILSTIMIRTAQQVAVRNAIIAYAQSKNIPYIDVYEDEFFRNEFMSPTNIVGGHPTATGHAGMAQAILRLTARCIFENSNYFKINTMYNNGNFSIESMAGLLGVNLITSTAHYKRDANTSHSATTYGIDTIQLNPGKYIFKWSQSAASATGSSSRCTPVMSIDDNKSYYASNQNFLNTVAGDYYWVVTIASKCVATFYFWSQNLSDAFEAWGFDLYDYNSVRGRLDKLNGLID